MSSLDVRLKKLEVLLGPPEPTLREVIDAATALNAQRKAEAALKSTPTDEGEPHHERNHPATPRPH